MYILSLYYLHYLYQNIVNMVNICIGSVQKSDTTKIKLQKATKLDTTQICVPTQFDKTYSDIADRQCSYFCMEIINKRKEFVKLYKRKKYTQFQELYEDCLMRATQKKHDSPDRPDIETLFHPNVLGKKIAKFYKMCYNQDNYCEEYEKLMSQLYKNYDDVSKTKLNLSTINEEYLSKVMINLPIGGYVAINRCVMSFVVIKYSDKEYLILDSHVKVVKLYTCEEIMAYIDSTKEYNLVTIMFD